MSTETASRRGPLLRIRQVSFAYTTRHVFSQWSHDFDAGLTWVRGHNGDGKSTLLKLLAGALVAHAGSIDIDVGADMATETGSETGHRPVDAGRHGLEYRRNVFWCGPGPIPFDHLSPAQYFGFMRQLYPKFDGAQLARHVAAFHLSAHLATPLHTLSTGTQRKVWLGAALAAGTAATLLDEPVNALDAASAGHLLSVLAERAQDAARICIVASHDPLGAAADSATMLDLSAPRSMTRR